MIGSGDSTKNIVKYWYPEAISQLIFIILPMLVDSYLVASLKSVTLYGALGTANNFLHLFLKFAEAIPVASVAIIGRHNGAKKYDKCGEDLGNTFWTSVFFGGLQFIVLLLVAPMIYRLLGVPEDMIAMGAPFLRLRSLGIFLIFVSLSLLYFMRGVKNTQTPMIISIIGVCSFVFFEYVLVLGKFGFPGLGLYGAALATIIQYSIVIACSLWYILTCKEYKKYFSTLFIRFFSIQKVGQLLNLSWPIMIDKTVMASCYIVTFKLIAPMGTNAIASFDVIKNLERFALLPAVAFAQIVTFLVSNRLGAQDPEGAKSNVKKVLILASLITSVALVAICIKASYFVSFFDQEGKFSYIAVPALVLVSTLVVFDFIQLILAGALRGAGDVKTVMITRTLTCLFFFAPLAYIVSRIPIESHALRFSLIYGTFYVNTALMGFIFMRRIIGDKWQNALNRNSL